MRYFDKSWKRAELTEAEIAFAERLIDRTFAWRALPYYPPEERLVLAIFAASQRARGRKSKSAAKRLAHHRRGQVELLLRYVISKKYRRDEKTARSDRTVMELINWLDSIGIEASPTQVRRDIAAVLRRGPLSP